MDTQNALIKSGDGTVKSVISDLTDKTPAKPEDKEKTVKPAEPTTDGEKAKVQPKSKPAATDKKPVGKGVQTAVVEPEQYILMKADGTYVVLAPIPTSQIPAALKNRTLKRVEIV